MSGSRTKGKDAAVFSDAVSWPLQPLKFNLMIGLPLLVDIDHVECPKTVR